MSGQQWVVRAGDAPRDGFDLVVDDHVDGWQHTGLRVVQLDEGRQVEVAAGAWEHLVVPLAGGVSVDATGPDGEREQVALSGRESVFAGATDVAFLPAGWSLQITGSAGGSRVAVCAAAVPGAPSHKVRHVRAEEVPVELRGAGVASREVRNFGVPDVLDAGRIIACEVVTPSGNWSSYPPHKHDEEREGAETELEEIYYFETRVEGGADRPGADPIGYQRVYGTEERPIDVLAEVRTGDVVLVPHGWHGPAMAPPGYDLYYLNVMAGPSPERAWRICDDPAHAWIRGTWSGQETDPRLPLTSADGRP